MASPDKDGSTFSVDALVKEILKDPKLGEAIEEVGEKYLDYVKATWPKSAAATTPTTRTSEVFELVKTDRSGKRPWVHVHVNHPYAVAHQARTGAFTKAAAHLGLEIRSL